MVHWPVIPWMYGMRMHMRRTVAVIGIKRGPAVIRRPSDGTWLGTGSS